MVWSCGKERKRRLGEEMHVKIVYVDEGYKPKRERERRQGRPSWNLAVVKNDWA